MVSNEPIRDVLLEEKLQRAKMMPGEEKLLAGARLFDLSCRIMMDGLRNQYPQESESELQARLDRQLRQIREMENSGLK